MVSADLGPEGREFEPWPVHPRWVFRRNSHSPSLHQVYKWEPANCFGRKPDKMLGGNLRWTSIPSRGSRNTPCRFTLQKPETSTSLMGLLARPIMITGQTYNKNSINKDYQP